MNCIPANDDEEFSALSLQDVAELLSEHGGFIGATLLKYAPTFATPNVENANAFAGELLTQSPAFIAAVLGRSSGEDPALIARKPAAIQLLGLARVINLTLAGSSARELVGELAAAVTPLKAHLGLTQH
jgi:hypothetical protein